MAKSPMPQDGLPSAEPGPGHVSGQRMLRFEAEGPTAIDAMARLRSLPPRELAGHQVTGIDDLLVDNGPLSLTDALVFHVQAGRVSVRPSDPVPGLELHGEFWQPPAGEDRGIPAGPHGQLLRVLNALSSLVCDPERAETTRHLESTDSDVGVEARASALFTGVPAGLSRSRALRLVVESIDLTTLAGDDTIGRVRALCAQARHPDPTDATVGPVAAVCVYPNLVAIASALTKDSAVAVASVAGAFPSGLSSLEVRLSDIAEAVCAGADEIDVVLNRSAFLGGDHQLVSDELHAMRQQVGPRVMKVILETSELASPAAIRAAALLAIDAGADWIKTSTGKSRTGATPLAVLAMAQAIAAHNETGDKAVGLKISGGVRTSADALGYLAIIEDVLGPTWLRPSRVRFGASGLLNAVVEDLHSASALT